MSTVYVARPAPADGPRIILRQSVEVRTVTRLIGAGDVAAQTLFVQNEAPVVFPSVSQYMWIQTGLGDDGSDFTIWIETGD